MDGHASEVGSQIRSLRVAAGLSLTELAVTAGIGKGSLSELEAGQRNPTLSTLYAVANALGVPLARLLVERPGAEVVSAGISARLVETLHQADGSVVEVYVLDLAGDRHLSDPHGPGVVEHLFVVAGSAVVGPTEAPVELSAGEAATWAADRPHAYRALSERATGILTITSP